MKIKVSAISRKEMPSKFGNTWQIVRIKVDGRGDEIFELEGFGKNEKEKIAAGTVLSGYFSERTWSGRNGPVVTKTFCKYTAEYLADILEKRGILGDVQIDEVIPVKEDEWGSGTKQNNDGFEDPGF